MGKGQLWSRNRCPGQLTPESSRAGTLCLDIPFNQNGTGRGPLGRKYEVLHLHGPDISNISDSEHDLGVASCHVRHMARIPQQRTHLASEKYEPRAANCDHASPTSLVPSGMVMVVVRI